MDLLESPWQDILHGIDLSLLRIFSIGFDDDLLMGNQELTVQFEDEVAVTIRVFGKPRSVAAVKEEFAAGSWRPFCVYNNFQKTGIPDFDSTSLSSSDLCYKKLLLTGLAQTRVSLI
ncbi:hypothetical protein SUGI_0941470 [Cryptomeria japonica]|nr:hypothetical protein SUGI_0941470 [Cryptomeria japonica]